MGWIIKMLLKLFKPFAKIMIMEAILDYFTEAEGDTTEEGDETTTAADDAAE